MKAILKGATFNGILVIVIIVLIVMLLWALDVIAPHRYKISLGGEMYHCNSYTLIYNEKDTKFLEAIELQNCKEFKTTTVVSNPSNLVITKNPAWRGE